MGSWSNNGGCFVEMRIISGSGYTALHICCTNGQNRVTGCITSLEAGIYNVDIFDINNNGQKDSSGKDVTISTIQVFPSSMYDSIERQQVQLCRISVM